MSEKENGVSRILQLEQRVQDLVGDVEYLKQYRAVQARECAALQRRITELEKQPEAVPELSVN